jgi:zinc transport system substrate-binding protein
LSPDSKPTPRALVEVVEKARSAGVKFVFFETAVSDDLARVLAKEIGARTLILNPGANLTMEELDSGMSFFDIMGKNLENLRYGLGCQ